ncbi:hypothetical protein [Mycolicibacterium sp. XJ775]
MRDTEFSRIETTIADELALHMPEGDYGQDGAKNLAIARAIVAALKGERIAVVELPDPFQVDITEIDMEPTGEPEWGGEPDHRPRMVIRFRGAPSPGSLFDRPKLAAALLAADIVEQENAAAEVSE